MADLIFKIGDLVKPDEREHSWAGKIGLYLKADRKSAFVSCRVYFPRAEYPHDKIDCTWYDILLKSLE